MPQKYQNQVDMKTYGSKQYFCIRLWAFTTIKEALENAADNVSTTAEIEVAYSTAMKYHFLTPFTNMMFFPAPKHDPTNRFQTEPAEEPSQR